MLSIIFLSFLFVIFLSIRGFLCKKLNLYKQLNYRVFIIFDFFHDQVCLICGEEYIYVFKYLWVRVGGGIAIFSASLNDIE